VPASSFMSNHFRLLSSPPVVRLPFSSKKTGIEYKKKCANATQTDILVPCGTAIQSSSMISLSNGDLVDHDKHWVDVTLVVYRHNECKSG
jgi:hypothetical protein